MREVMKSRVYLSYLSFLRATALVSQGGVAGSRAGECSLFVADCLFPEAGRFLYSSGPGEKLVHKVLDK